MSSFTTFDGLDNRKTVYDLFVRMGKGLSEDDAGLARAGFLCGLIARYSVNGFADVPATVEPCNASDAYHLFVAITSHLGVNIVEAANLLEAVIRALPRAVDGDRRSLVCRA